MLYGDENEQNQAYKTDNVIVPKFEDTSTVP